MYSGVWCLNWRPHVLGHRRAELTSGGPASLQRMQAVAPLAEPPRWGLFLGWGVGEEGLGSWRVLGEGEAMKNRLLNGFDVSVCSFLPGLSGLRNR